MIAPLPGCTLAPVYGTAAAPQAAYAVRYAEPHSRLAQIITQRLRLSFPATTDPAAPLLSVSARGPAGDLYRSRTGDFAKPLRATVTAEVTLSRQGKPIARFSRFASADYTSVGQAFSNSEAAIEARERAAAAVAETIRLSLLTMLPAP